MSAVLPEKLSWLGSEDIRPYVFVRKDNRISQPGEKHSELEWFKGLSPVYKDPLQISEVEFANHILQLETQAFDASGMAMDRWVFYDCAVMPGFVAGFAARTASLSDAVKKKLKVSEGLEWTPLSLFIIIPTMAPKEWVAHNLCSVNSILEKEDRWWGLGFMSKAFGLWYANIETCIGMTQWSSPALKLHSYYGFFNILTAYTPVHSYAKTLTYRLDVNTSHWAGFLGQDVDYNFKQHFSPAGFSVDRNSEESLKSLQLKIEQGQSGFYLDAEEILSKSLDEELMVYCKN